MRRRIINWTLVLAFVVQVGSCVFRGESHMPQMRGAAPAITTAA